VLAFTQQQGKRRGVHTWWVRSSPAKHNNKGREGGRSGGVLSWIWPEEKGIRLAVDPTRGEEGRPSGSRFGRGRRRAATPSSIWPGEKKGGHPIGRRLGFWLAAMSSCTMPDPRHRGPFREQGDLSAREGREGELALGTEEQGRRRRRQSAGRRS
jgi:hypothetical protein